MHRLDSGKRIAVLGSTGSIGKRTLDVIAAAHARGEHGWQITGLTANGSWQALAEQARRFRPARVALADEAHLPKLKEALAGLPIEVLGGTGGIVEVASAEDTNFVVCAIVGAASIHSALAAVSHGKDLALASKEALVVAGQIVMTAAQASGAAILPVDSEHSAIFQSLRAGNDREVQTIILTASGGPFFSWPIEKIHAATVQQALAHPTWSMGPKITIDSATMMNKGLELIEAHLLFNMPCEKIGVVIHPESIIHGLVEFIDGSQIAQLGRPDMAVPIQYALTYPERLQGIAPRLSLSDLGKMTFHPPDDAKFPSLALARHAADRGGTAPAVMNAANEAAVDGFLREKIPFRRIVELAEEIMVRHEYCSNPSLDELLEIDAWARQQVQDSF
jgi:1-deoxy-D-xylulose-5-phosphate reductoisomerase